MIVMTCGKPDGGSGMIEASTTDRPSVPWTRPDASTTAPSSAASTYEVAAPLSGTIVSVNKASGEQVAPGEPIMEIVALETVWVEVIASPP